MNVSVVIPFFNEEENVEELVSEIMKAPLQEHDLEVILVDDGSSDATWERIQSCARQHAAVRGSRCPINQGQSSALYHGLHEAKGDVLVTLDGDLQNDPADIPTLLRELGEYDVACGYRANRRDSWSRRAGSRLANRVRNWVTHDGIRDTGCGLKAFRSVCLADLPLLDGFHRFMPAHFRLHGRSIIEIPVNHRPRIHGTSKYTNLKRLPKTLFDLFGFAWYRSRTLKRLKLDAS